MPFPVALVKLNDNELVWYNRAFAELTHVRERMSAQSLSEVRESRAKFRSLVNPQAAKPSPIIEDV